MLDIDEPEVAASVHVYVNTSRLTSLDPRALLVVTARPAHPTLVPCTPAQPGVRVQLLAGDTELTEYQGPVINLCCVLNILGQLDTKTQRPRYFMTPFVTGLRVV